jgi:hypothetical protein
MSTEAEAIAGFLEVAEGKVYIELLFSFPLPYEVVLKYEKMREKTFKVSGLPYSSSRIWRLQNDANRKAKQKNLKTEETDKNHQDYTNRLSISHDINLRFIKLFEDILVSYEKTESKLKYMTDNNPGLYTPMQLKTLDLEFMNYKDLNKLKDLEQEEIKQLEYFSQRLLDKEKETLKAIKHIEDKFFHYEKSLQNLESVIDNIAYKHHTEKKELESKLQDLMLKCNNLDPQDPYKPQASGEIEKLCHENMMLYNKKLLDEILSLKNEIKEVNLQVSLTSSDYKQQICELQIKNNQLQEEIILYKAKYNEIREEIGIYKDKSRQYIDEIDRKKDERFVSAQSFSSRGENIEKIHQLKETLDKIQGITHKVFVRYEKSHEEWGEEYIKDQYPGSNEYSRVLYELNFLYYMIAKLAGDNNWLVDRLSDLGKENQRLKEDVKTFSPRKIDEDAINDLRAASTALKGFEDARSKLLTHFSDAKKDNILKY